MPELPEVETIRRTLKNLVVGKEIEDVEIRWSKIIKKPEDSQAFSLLLAGQTIHDISRKGKFLLFILDDYTLVSHLRMEGKYNLGEGEPCKHTHVRFFFNDGVELRYRDVRKFGTMHLFPKGTEFDIAPLKKLGPEPLETTFSTNYLQEKLGKTTRTIKAVLLDQAIVAGLGNIYVDEALFRAGINPERTAPSLSREEITRLHEHVKQTIEEAVAAGGSSIRSYLNGNGEMGYFQHKLFVYGRKGEACRQCDSIIERGIVAGRGTHFCARCQPVCR